VIMMLRIQRERQSANFFPTLDEYAQYFCLTEEAVRLAKPQVIILHPGPLNRGLEIASAVADGPYSVIMDQVTNGVAVRMALLYLLIARSKAEDALEPEALAGGFTSVACMGNTEPPNDSAAVTQYILDRARIADRTRVYPIGALSLGLRGERLAEIGEMHRAGIVAVSDDGHPVMDAALMRR